MSKLPIAIQVYSVREEAAKDFRGTMKAIREMGYDGVELAGLYDLSPKEIKDCLDELGLIPISAHVPIEEMEADLDNTLDKYVTIGCKFIAIPGFFGDRSYGKPGYESSLKVTKLAAAACAQRGLTLLYHNHDFEFDKNNDGIYVIDELYGMFSKEELQTEFDTCWVKVAGESPEAYLDKYTGRCPVVHIKNFKKEDNLELVALPEGDIDICSVVKAAEQNGAQWLVIEQDSHTYGTPMANMEKSIQWLRSQDNI